MWPPIYQCFESHSCLYTEFTVAGEEKCMLNSASANTVQGIQGACTTSPSFSKIQKCIHTLDKSRQSITGHSNWFIQNRPLPVQSERIPRYKLSLSSFIPGNEMNGGSDTCGLNSFWYGTHVIGVCLSFNGGVVF